MKYPHFLTELTLFKELLKKGSVYCKKKNTTVEMQTNLFGEDNFFINDKKIISLPGDTIKKKLTEIFLPLFFVLAEEEKFTALQELVEIQKIKNYHTFNDFFQSGIYQSTETDEYVELAAKFVLLEEDGYTYYINESEISEKNLKDIHLMFCVVLNYEVIDITNWKKNKQQRIRAMIDSKYNPNDYLRMHLEEIFKREEFLKTAKEHPLVNHSYSTFNDSIIAFNIKVYEDFVNKELYDLDILTYEEDGENRQDAVESLIEELKNNKKTDYAIHEIMIDGKNGGYLLVDFLEAEVEALREVASIIEKAKKETYKIYQDIEHYKHYDYILESLKEKKELFEKNEDKENLKKINTLIKNLT